jgi:hypothetical protein
MSAATVVSSGSNSTTLSLKDMKDLSQYAVTKEVLAARLNNQKLDPEDKTLIKQYLSSSNKTKAKEKILSKLFILMIERLMNDTDYNKLSKISDRVDAFMFALESCGIKRADLLNEKYVREPFLSYLEKKAPDVFQLIVDGEKWQIDQKGTIEQLSSSLVETISQLNATKDLDEKVDLDRKAYATKCAIEWLGGDARYPLSKYISKIMPGLNEAQNGYLAKMWNVLETPEKYDDNLAEVALKKYLTDGLTKMAKKEQSYENAFKSEEYANLRTFAVKTMNISYVISRGQNIAPDRVFYRDMVNLAYTNLTPIEAKLYVDYYVDRASGNTEKANNELSQIKTNYLPIKGKGTPKAIMYEELNEVLRVPLQ